MSRFLTLLALFLTAAAVFASGASAHARLMGESPSAGSTVTSPRAVTLRFDDVIEAPPRALQAFDPAGTDVAGTPTVPNDRALQAPLPARLPDGSYTVKWRIVADDGHIEAGTFVFHVRGSRANAGAGAPPGAPAGGGGGGATRYAIAAIMALAVLATAAVGVALAGTFGARRLRIPAGALAVGAFAAMALVGLLAT